MNQIIRRYFYIISICCSQIAMASLNELQGMHALLAGATYINNTQESSENSFIESASVQDDNDSDGISLCSVSENEIIQNVPKKNAPKKNIVKTAAIKPIKLKASVVSKAKRKASSSSSSSSFKHAIIHSPDHAKNNQDDASKDKLVVKEIAQRKKSTKLHGLGQNVKPVNRPMGLVSGFDSLDELHKKTPCSDDAPKNPEVKQLLFNNTFDPEAFYLLHKYPHHSQDNGSSSCNNSSSN